MSIRIPAFPAAGVGTRAPPDDPIGEFEIDPDPIWPADDVRLEPIFFAGALWAEFALDFESEPTLPRWEEPDAALLLGDEASGSRAADADVDAGARIGSHPQRTSPFSLVGSLGVHLLPLLLLIAWSGGQPGRVAEAVPVQLVLERAPPEGPVAEAANDAAPAPAETLPEQRPSAHYASTLPPPAPQPSPLPAPRPISVPAPTHAPRKAVPAKEQAAPQPAPVKRAASNDSTTASAVPPRLRAGPAMMTREQYLAYLAELTWRHVDMLPASFLGTRSGKTVISIKVVRDGTVLGISVAESSGYPDIDARVAQMVAAIGRFPPLPPSIAESITELRLTLRFPQVLQR